MAFLPYTVPSTQPDLALKQIDGELYTLHDLPDTAYSLFSLTPTFAVREIKCSSNALPVGEEEQPGFRVYPTVVTQMLTVESDNDFQSVMICDLAGKKVLEQKGNFSQLLTLDLSHLSRGSYLVAVNGGPSGRRIIKVE
jgi:hypothetical protein